MSSSLMQHFQSPSEWCEHHNILRQKRGSSLPSCTVKLYFGLWHVWFAQDSIIYHPSETESSSAAILIKGGFTVSPKDRLTGDVLDESTVQILLQRWYPPPSRRLPIKHFHVSQWKKRKVLWKCKDGFMNGGFIFHLQALDFISEPRSVSLTLAKSQSVLSLAQIPNAHI